MDINQFVENLKKSLDFFKEDIKSLRTGRATPSLVEEVKVEYYGTETPLSQLASISVPEPRMIMIKPYDKSTLALIEKAISESELGLTASNDGNIVRASIPALNEERRKELVKVLSQKAEEARVSMRNSRREVVEDIEGKEKAGEISEDEKFQKEKEIQDKLDSYIKQIDEVVSLKEIEITEV